MLTVGCKSQSLTLDGKRRVMVPAQFREGESQGPWRFYIGHEKDPCLYLHTEEHHKVYVERLRRMFGDAHPDERDALRAIVGSWAKVTTDGQGRLTLQPEHVSKAELESEVTIVAGHDRMEIWNPAQYSARREEALDEAWEKLESHRIEYRDELEASHSDRSGDRGEGDGPAE
ncbi:MAG: hypothetical protein CMJ83_14725 [Planctomycetes bacterium]|jgi:MraZ protein|nr:hypothetical protein [Planctomycetota bacterium]